MSKWPGCPVVACKNDLCDEGCQAMTNSPSRKLHTMQLALDHAHAKNERLRALLQQAIECCRSSAGAEERNNFIRDARHALEPKP